MLHLYDNIPSYNELVMMVILVCVWGWLNSGQFQKKSDTIELPHETDSEASANLKKKVDYKRHI